MTHGRITPEEIDAVIAAGNIALEAIAGRQVLELLDDNEQDSPYIVRGTE